MVIEMDTMKMFPVLGFVVNNHTKRLLGIISNIAINNLPYLAQQSVSFLKPATLGEKIQRSSAYIKWLIKVPA